MGCCEATHNTKREKDSEGLCFQSNNSSISFPNDTQDLKPDPTFMENDPSDYRKIQKKLNPELKSEENQNLFSEKAEEENGGIKKQEKVKKAGLPPIKNQLFENSFNQELSALLKGFEDLTRDSEEIKNEIKLGEKEIKTRITIRELKDYFYDEKAKFLDYISRLKEANKSIEGKENKLFCFEIDILVKPEGKENLMENLSIILPKNTKILINPEGGKAFLELKGWEIKEENLILVIRDLLEGK